MSTVKLYSTVTSTTDLLRYIEEDVLSFWTVDFFSHYLSVMINCSDCQNNLYDPSTTMDPAH